MCTVRQYYTPVINGNKKTICMKSPFSKCIFEFGTTKLIWQRWSFCIKHLTNHLELKQNRVHKVYIQKSFVTLHSIANLQWVLFLLTIVQNRVKEQLHWMVSVRWNTHMNLTFSLKIKILDLSRTRLPNMS